jgi:hypothetical protein
MPDPLTAKVDAGPAPDPAVNGDPTKPPVEAVKPVDIPAALSRKVL